MEAVKVKEKPILFTTENVKAILGGRKTQTRRILKPQPHCEDSLECGIYTPALIDKDGMMYPADYQIFGAYTLDGEIGWKFPYGTIGDKLWVRETWKPYNCMGGISYKADGDTHGKWKPSIHMFKEYARIWLRITNIKIERVQDITESDAIAEGSQLPIENLPKSCQQAVWSERQQFSRLWDSINLKSGSWESNPWVWVISFVRTSRKSPAELYRELYS